MAQNLGFPVPPSQNPPEREDRRTDEQLQRLAYGFAPFPDPKLAIHRSLRDLAEEVRSISGLGSCAVGLIEGSEFICRAAAGESAPAIGTRIRSEDGLSADCIRLRHSQICLDTLTDSRVDAAACRAMGVRSVMVVPLLSQRVEKLIGVLEAFSPDSHAFGPAVSERIEAVAHRIVELLDPVADGAPERSAEPRGNGLAALQPASLPVSPPVLPPAYPSQRIEPSAQSIPTGQNPSVRVTAPQDQAWTQSGVDSLPLATIPSVSPRLAPPMANVPLPVAPPALTAPLLTPNRPPRQSLPNLMLALSVLAAGMLLAGLLVWVQQEKARRDGLASAKTAASVSDSAAAQPPAALPRTASDGDSSAQPKPTAAVQAQRISLPNGNSAPKTRAEKRLAEADSLPSSDLIVYEKGRVIYPAAPVTSASETERLGETANPVPAAAAKTQEGVPLGAFAGGTLIQRVPPVYPAEARALRLEGDVVLQGVIGKDGAVRDIHVVSGDTRLVDAAVAAVRQWRYDPFRSNDEPVDMLSTVTVHFRLPRASNQ